MVVWINGPFGGGKTTVARLLADSRPGLRLVDPERVGYLVSAEFADTPHDDFQELDVWAELVPVVIDAIRRQSATEIVAPQTVLRPGVWDQLIERFDALGIPVHHVVLDCAGGELLRRIEGDEQPATTTAWRLEHIEAFMAARRWLFDSADLVIDTTTIDPADVVATIANEV